MLRVRDRKSASGKRRSSNAFVDSFMWFEPLNIHLAVGVDGISVLMIMLSAIIVFTGTFASWKVEPLTKEYFLWFILLSIGVFGFFISIDLFTMFMFYEVALIPMYLLIGVWGSGNKNYATMKLTLMLMGGSAFLLISILGIYYHAGETMNLLEIAQTALTLVGRMLSSYVHSLVSAFLVLCSHSTLGLLTVTLQPLLPFQCFTQAF